PTDPRATRIASPLIIYSRGSVLADPHDRADDEEKESHSAQQGSEQDAGDNEDDADQEKRAAILHRRPTADVACESLAFLPGASCVPRARGASLAASGGCPGRSTSGRTPGTRSRALCRSGTGRARGRSRSGRRPPGPSPRLLGR